MIAVAEIRSRIAADPMTFPRAAWRRTYWSRQAELYAAFHTSKRVAAKGGHGTGKTFSAADYIIEHTATHPGAQTIVLGPTFDQAKDNLWQKVRAAFFSSRFAIGGEMGADSWTLGDGWYAKVRGADRPEALHGVHGPAVLIVVDEAAGLNPTLWSAVESLMASEGAQLVLLFNPTKPTGFAREACDNPAFKVVTLSCLDHPNVVSGENVYPGAVPKSWVDETKARCDRVDDQDYWRSHVLGEFPAEDPDALVSSSDLEASLLVTAKDVPRLALDVARFGSDHNVLTYVDAERRAIVADEWAGQDLMHSTGRLIAATRKFNVSPSMTFVDACGVGGGVVDRARELGCSVRAVDAGAKATGRWAHIVGRETQFLNIRAEMFWAVRCLVKSKALNVSRDYWSDLAMIRKGYASGGEVKIRSKDEMRKEHGRSPDRADSLALAFADPSPTFLARAG